MLAFVLPKRRPFQLFSVQLGLSWLCAGEVNNIIKFFTFKLKQYGATNEEISEMLSAMTQISYSPVKLKFSIHTIFARSELDSINTEYNQRYEKIYGEPLQGIKGHH